MAMENHIIDWNQAWKEIRNKTAAKSRGLQFWDKKPKYDAGPTTDEDYSNAFLEIMDPGPDWSVLDMACGTGALAVPLAKKVKSVTAVDFSSNMLDMLDCRCKSEGISNVKMIQGSWEDDWDSIGIEEHDVAIASRSLVVEDLHAAISKLHKIARKKVYISTILGDGPHDRRIFKAVGRELHPGPDYIYNYNLLYQMGIQANVRIIKEVRKKSYAAMEDAFNNIRWMMGGTSDEEDVKLTAYLKKHLVYRNKQWSLDYQNIIRWAVMWWEKEN